MICKVGIIHSCKDYIMTHFLAGWAVQILTLLAFISIACENKHERELRESERSGLDSVSIRWEIFTSSRRIDSTMLVQKSASDDPIHLRSSYGKEALMRTLSLFAVEVLNDRDPEMRVRDSTQEFEIIVHRDTIRRRGMDLVVITLENIGRYDYRIFATISVERRLWLSYIYVPVFGDALMVEYKATNNGVWFARRCYTDSMHVEYVRTVAQKVLNRHSRGKLLEE